MRLSVTALRALLGRELRDQGLKAQLPGTSWLIWERLPYPDEWGR